MGFFADLKEDLNQAVNELLTEESKEAKDEKHTSQETMQDLGEVEELEDIQDLEAAMADLQQTMDSLQISIAGLAEAETDTISAFPGNDLEQDRESQTVKEELPEDTDLSEAEELPAKEDLAEKEDSTPEQAPVVEEAALPQELPISLVSDAEEVQALPEPAGNLEESLRATFGAPAGEETLEEYLEKETVRTGGDVIDRSWVLDLKNLEPSDETAIVTAGMRVKGDILSNGSLDVIGEVQGNVQVVGKLNITGKVVGHSKAEEVFADAARITGDILSDGTVKIGAGSVVKGNIEATSAVIAGAVKGTIDVKGPVILDATAVVLGNIRAKSMQINNGARIEGMCVLCYAEQSAAKFFENQDEM